MSGSSSSDSDSAFEEEVVVQRYLKQDLKSGLAQGRALLRHHDGVKPQPGHYKVSITPYPRAKVKLQSGLYKVMQYIYRVIKDRGFNRKRVTTRSF